MQGIEAYCGGMCTGSQRQLNGPTCRFPQTLFELVLTSQRALQFGVEQSLSNNFRLIGCKPQLLPDGVQEKQIAPSCLGCLPETERIEPASNATL